MTAVVIAPHPDDEAIGCGGAILRHRERGEAVHVLFLTSGELALKHLDRDEAWAVREREAGAATAVLGGEDPLFLRLPDWSLADHGDEAIPALAELLARLDPAVVYVPHRDEWHPDHKAAHSFARAACEHAGIVESALLGYEVWTPLREWDVVEAIDELIDTKLEAIRCYPSQLTAFDYLQAATGLAQYRGALAGHCAHAEVFRRGG